MLLPHSSLHVGSSALDKFMGIGNCIISPFVAFSFRLFGRSHFMEMGIWSRLLIWFGSSFTHRVLPGWIVSCLSGVSCKWTLLKKKYNYRMYHRQSAPLASTPAVRRKGSIIQRVKDVVGITGIRAARADPPWSEICFAIIKIAWRPHLLLILFFEVCQARVKLNTAVTLKSLLA